ncbi:MAG: tetratricopeptide repeat-containing serine protease family protein [Xenococcaceae cyanobacterium MO_188.B29]|nr:tetratricopeptide repeat-containing serine protease family protein [Xenococcaceae cyanobacterium MO_188.B29]
MLLKSLLSISLLASMGTYILLTPVEVKGNSPLQKREEKTTEIAVIAQLPKLELETIARAITVQVYVGKERASGILIARDDNTYTVITNAHVAERGDTYSIETPDGVKHTATLTRPDGSETGNDLALLQFHSSNNYQIATVGDSSKVTVGEAVIAAGFPFDADKLKITTGTISLLPDKSLEGGYQIGFTNETVQGMSGGVLLNANGEVIGVLGKGKGAIFDSAYSYSDGTNPTAAELENLKDASFSIPIAKVAEIAPQLVAILPETPTGQTPTQTKQYTGIVGTVDKIARQITVRIDNLTDKSNGSGVIIAKQANSYYVVTAKHVLCTNLKTSGCEANGQHQIVTPDGVTHKLDYQTVKASGTWLDVAVFKFESTNNYSVATLGKYDVGVKVVFVSGFPGKDSTSKTQPTRLLTGGLVQKEEEKEFATKDAYSLLSNGEGLVYTNLSYGGMSGGAVLDTQGRLVGINTGAENEIKFDEEGHYSQLSLGFSLGVGIQDFLGLVEKGKTELKPQWLQVETSPTSEITKADIVSIQEQLLTATEPNIDAGVVAWVNYGNQLWRYGRYTEAVKAFRQAIELEPSFDKAYYAMGLAFWFQGEYEPAVFAFKKATEINPAPYYYWRRLGSSYLLLKKYAEARAAYDTAISQNPEDFVLYVERGSVLRASEDYRGAIESYTQALKLNSDHPWAYNNRGLAYEDLQQYDKALADYNRALEINPQLAEAYSNRGNVYLNLQQYDKALADQNRALEFNPQDANVYNNRGNVYLNLQQYERALADYTKAIEINPQNAKAYYNRGLVYRHFKQDDKALADYTKTIELNPQDADAYYNRGLTYTQLQQYERALADQNRAIELNPQLAQTYWGRGLVYVFLGNLPQARSDWQQAATLFQQQNNSQGYQIVQELLKKLSRMEAQ